jgi:ATP-dependent exoDNAse (exonuclease V) beta subunit
MERVLDLGERGRGSDRMAAQSSPALGGSADDEPGGPGRRSEAAARGAAVHSLLEWSQANGWGEPSAELIARHAALAGIDPANGAAERLLGPIRAWLGSRLLRERIAADGVTSRAEVPLLLGVERATLRGSIDLLAEREDAPPLVLDYKTDRLGGASPAERAGKYSIQRAVYALAVAEARGAEQVEVAYVFLERPDEPVLTLLDAEAIERGRRDLAAVIARIGAGEFPVAPPERRDWDLCRGCPALGKLCSGPEAI